ncbi:MAG: hypothetical protein SFW36_08320 [Leptolyngbyaceae cyanobacterium bins.59]|nr:hypothetical protein [Leptolyngbyaceae cyanobacterium bins.59]
METTSRSDHWQNHHWQNHHWQTLGQLLEQQLKTVLPPSIPVTVQCVVKEGVLMVLGQHPAHAVPDPQQTFKTLEKGIRSFAPQVSNPSPDTPDSPKVQLYLRVSGQQQPYAFHAFELTPSLLPPPPPPSPSRLPPPPSSPPPTAIEVAKPHEQAPAFTEPLLPPEPEDVEPQPEPTPSPPRKSRKTILAGLGLGLGAALVGVFAYGITRPCVLGGCDALATAQQLNWESTQILQKPDAARSLPVAQEKLTTAIRSLDSIPPWSPQRSEAQTLQTTYRTQLTTLEQLTTAQQKVTTATQQTQKPPLSVQEWQAVQKLWKEAIDALKQIPKENPYHSYAQTQLKDYRARLRTVDQQASVERQATDNLTEAKRMVQIAEARQGVSQNLESWQLTQVTWQGAIDRLKKVPKSTTVYKESQELLAIYQPKFVTARNQWSKEQLSARAYNQAMSVAKQAEALEQKQQWPQAVDRWRSAINLTRQVLQGTESYDQAQLLLDEYRGKLSAAESTLQVSQTLQQARTDLKRTCSLSVRVCDYTVAPELIRVNLTRTYMQKLIGTAETARRFRDPNAQVQVSNHLETLFTAFRTISDNAQIPIEIYNPDGVMMVRYPK